MSVTEEAQGTAPEGNLDFPNNSSSGEKNKETVYQIFVNMCNNTRIPQGEFVYEHV